LTLLNLPPLYGDGDAGCVPRGARCAAPDRADIDIKGRSGVSWLTAG
jgi:hypothetical protein